MKFAPLIVQSTIHALQPEVLFQPFENRLKRISEYKKIWVIGAGKASAAMAQAFEKQVGSRIEDGVVIVNEGNEIKLNKIRVVTGTHPFVSQRNLDASQEMLELLSRVGPDDLVITLFSGGGSALFEEFNPGVELSDYLSQMQKLYRSGKTIAELNQVRKSFSAVKGGGLIRRFSPKKWLNFVLSDVPGDDLGTVASGPSFSKNPADRIENVLIGSNQTAIDGVISKANELGLRTVQADFDLNHDVKAVADEFEKYARAISSQSDPVLLVAGGEMRIKPSGNGKGGRNQHLVLEMILRLLDLSRTFEFVSFGTDGIDGPTDAAGGMINQENVLKAKDIQKELKLALDYSDSYSALKKIQALLITGPTHTNVADVAFMILN